MDKEAEIHDPPRPYHLSDLQFNMYSRHFKGEDTFRVVESGLYYQISPSIYHFPKFVSWLTASYVDDKKCFISYVGVKIMEITQELILKAFVYPVSPNHEKFKETTLFYTYNTFLAREQQAFLHMILAPGHQTLPIVDSFLVPMFTKVMQTILTLITLLFGEDDTTNITKAAIRFLGVMMQPCHVFDIPSFLAKSIKFQLHHFPITTYFLYYSILLYMFIYTHKDEFEYLGRNLMDSCKQRKYVFDKDVVRKKPNNEGYAHFISTYMSTAYKIIYNVSPLRILPQRNAILQVRKDIKVGDWYLFEDYTEIRVYGSKLPPYHLLVFMPMRTFALEFIPQRLHADQIHFVLVKKGYMFKLGKLIGHFIVNTRQAFQRIEDLLKEMNFELGEIWH